MFTAPGHDSPFWATTLLCLDARECAQLPVTIMLTWKPNMLQLQQFQRATLQSASQDVCKTAKRAICKTPHREYFGIQLYFPFWKTCEGAMAVKKSVSSKVSLNCTVLRRSVKVFCQRPTVGTQMHGHCTRMTGTSIETVAFSLHDT